MAAQLLGRTQPRLSTPPLRRLTRATSHGYALADFAEAIGEPLLPWQRYLAIHALELNRDGSYRFRIIVCLVGRQNGKSSFVRTLSLWKLFVAGVQLILGVAQDLSLAREQYQMCLDTIGDCADLAEELDHVRRVNGDESFRLAECEIAYDDGEGDESFTLAGGGRYKIAASNRKAGRGLSVDQLVIDEIREWRNVAPWAALFPTTAARPNAQIICITNAGDDESVVLHQLRDAALSGQDATIGLFEWSAPDNCELDDRRAWAQANPALGHTIGEQVLLTAKSSSTPAVFRTEFLCQFVPQLDGAIDFGAWQRCHDPAGNMDTHRDRLACCFDAAPDGEHATLAAAAVLADGRTRIEIIQAWRSTGEARAELPALLARIKPAALGWFPTGPAAELASILRPAAAKANHRPGKPQAWWLPESGEITGAKVAEVCQELAGLIRGRRIIQPGDDLLDPQVKAAQKLPSGDGWRFTRKSVPGAPVPHVDAVYAAAGAVSIALTMPAPRRASIRLVG